MSNTKKNVAICAVWSLWALILGLAFWSFPGYPPKAYAEDGAGAYTKTNAIAEGYHANKETAVYTTLDGTDTVTGLEDPVTKFSAARIFRLYDPNSKSDGVVVNLKIQLKFSTGGANATIWVAYYYVDPDVPATYHLIAIKQPLGGTITATAAKEGALFLAPVSVTDTYGATHCVVFSDSVSAGTAALWLGSY